MSPDHYNTIEIDQLDSAHWGPCCWCTAGIYVRPIGVLGKGTPAHAKLVVVCDNKYGNMEVSLDLDAAGPAQSPIGITAIWASFVQPITTEGLIKIAEIRVDCECGRQMIAKLKGRKKAFYCAGIHDRASAHKQAR